MGGSYSGTCLCGLPLCCRVDGQLFKRSSKGGTDCSVTDGEFADDAVLFATTHCDAQDMLTEFVDVAGAFGLTVNMVKTLFMAVGYGVTDNDRSSLVIRKRASAAHCSLPISRLYCFI